MIQGFFFLQNSQSIFMGPMKGDVVIDIAWHVIYQFSVFFLNYNDGNNKNLFWA